MAAMTLQEFAQSVVAEFGTTGNAPLCSIEAVVRWAAQERANLRELIELVAWSPAVDCAFCPMPGGCGEAEKHPCRTALFRHYHLPDDPRQPTLEMQGNAARGGPDVTP